MSLRAAIVDLDGTIYRGETVVPGAPAAIQSLRDAGLSVLFFSNNPTKTPAQYVKRLAGMGIEVDEERVLTSGVVTAAYLAAHHRSEAIYLIGEEGLRRQLESVTLTTDPEGAEVVVASIDRNLTFETLTKGVQALETGAHPFIGTDPDGMIPTAGGKSIPGTGAILGALSGAVGREPDLVLGKPSEQAVRMALERLGVAAEECLVIGDRVDTDIAMGGRNGMQTALVLSGAHTEWHIERFPDTPDAVFESIASVETLLD